MSGRHRSIRWSSWVSVSAALGTLLVVACGSTSSESVSGPVPAKCAVTLSAAADPVEASGGARTVAVTTAPECAWTAASEAAWITEVAPVSGQGTGVVLFRVGANPNATAREGALNINNQRALVRQAPSPCSLQAAINDGHFTPSGGAATITVTTPGGCAWTASTNAGWIVLTAPASGSGAATLGVTIAQNVGAQRAGTDHGRRRRYRGRPGRRQRSGALRHLAPTDIRLDAGRRRLQ